MLLSQIPRTQLNQIRRMTGPIFTQATFSLSWCLISIERLACMGTRAAELDFHQIVDFSGDVVAYQEQIFLLGNLTSQLSATKTKTTTETTEMSNLIEVAMRSSL